MAPECTMRLIRVANHIISPSSQNPTKKSSTCVLHEWCITKLADSRLPNVSGMVAMLLLGCVFFAARPLQAQLPTAKVAGTVSDPSGATIPGATITLTNTSNGFAYVAISNDSGEYVVPNLAPSNYRLTVEAKGFNVYSQEGIILVVNQATTVNPVLHLGSSVQTVQVTAAAPLMETSTAHLGQTVTGNEIRELPLVGRDATQLIALAPGIAPAPGSSAAADNGMNFDPNGGRYDITDVTVDGVSQTGPDFEERGIVYVPSIDALQEFKVEENNFSADTGFTAALMSFFATTRSTPTTPSAMPPGCRFPRCTGTISAAHSADPFGRTRRFSLPTTKGHGSQP